MQTDEAPKGNSTGQPKQSEHLPKEKIHGKIYTTAQHLKDKFKDKMKSIGSFEIDDKDDNGLIIALISSSSS